METVYGHTYRNETVDIDGKNFDHCKFDNVTLRYHGAAPMKFASSDFTGKLFLVTDNDAAAAYAQLTETFRRSGVTFGSPSTMDSNGNITPIFPANQSAP